MTYQKHDLLLIVETYPNLSKKYDKTVCMAGIDMKSYEWMRIYPVPFFDIPVEKRPHKWERLEIFTERNLSEKLKRKESNRIDYTKIRKLGGISTKNAWSDRNNIVYKNIAPSIEFLEEASKVDRTSLGFIKPKYITDFYVEPIANARDWERELVEGTQKTLFNAVYRSPIEKIPYRFAYKFRCNDGCRGHDLMVEDWELFALYRGLIKRGDDEQTAMQKCIYKYKDEFLSKKDIGFFVGTESRWNKWLIIGVYYPPKTNSIQT